MQLGFRPPGEGMPMEPPSQRVKIASTFLSGIPDSNQRPSAWERFAPPATTHTSKSFPTLICPRRPKTSRVVALEVGFEAGSFSRSLAVHSGLLHASPCRSLSRAEIAAPLSSSNPCASARWAQCPPAVAQHAGYVVARIAGQVARHAVGAAGHAGRAGAARHRGRYAEPAGQQ